MSNHEKYVYVVHPVFLERKKNNRKVYTVGEAE